MSTPQSSETTKSKSTPKGRKPPVSTSRKSIEGTQVEQEDLQNVKKFFLFNSTYKPDNEDEDTFQVIFPEKSSGYVIGMYNIPKVWSVKNLGKIYENLFHTYNNISHGTPEDTVKAIIEATLAETPETINNAFNVEHDNDTFTNYCTKVKGTSVADFALYVAKNACSTHSPVKRFYIATATGNGYPENIANLPKKHQAKLIMTWLSSYIVLRAFVDRSSIRAEYGGRVNFSKLQSICGVQIPNVLNHFQKFFKHQISKFVQLDSTKFLSASFLPTLDDENNDVDNLFLDSAKIIGDIQSNDEEACELLRLLVKQVVEKSEIQHRNEQKQLKEFDEFRLITCRQAVLLNALKVNNAVEKFYTDRLEIDLRIIIAIRRLYYRFRGKVNMPPSCTVEKFLQRTMMFLESEYEKLDDRSTAEQEVYKDDTVKMKIIKSVQIQQQELNIDPVQLENLLEESLGVSSSGENALDKDDLKMPTQHEIFSSTNVLEPSVVQPNFTNVPVTDLQDDSFASVHEKDFSFEESVDASMTSAEKSDNNDFADLIVFPPPDLGDDDDDVEEKDTQNALVDMDTD